MRAFVANIWRFSSRNPDLPIQNGCSLHIKTSLLRAQTGIWPCKDLFIKKSRKVRWTNISVLLRKCEYTHQQVWSSVQHWFILILILIILINNESCIPSPIWMSLGRHGRHGTLARWWCAPSAWSTPMGCSQAGRWSKGITRIWNVLRHFKDTISLCSYGYVMYVWKVINGL